MRPNPFALLLASIPYPVPERSRNVSHPTPSRTGPPLAARSPTSHEQRSGRPWDAFYQDGPAPWDIGQPQPAIARLAAAGAFTGPVLDVGCGTGEHTLLLASLGLSVLGVDVAETALAIARRKSAERGIAAEFELADALHLEALGRRFQTVLDCGLFHTFDCPQPSSPDRPAGERSRYAASLASVTDPGATLYVLCFSDQGPLNGPHPVHDEELHAAFNPAAGWKITQLVPDRIQTRFHENGAPAWLATIQRI